MKRLLVCLDGSQRAPVVLSSAVDLARATGAKVHLFRAVGVPQELPIELYSLSPNDIPNVLLENAKKQLTELSRTVPPELLGGVGVHLGTAWDAICTAARELDADVVVIGSHGYSGFDRVLGTTAAKVVNHADRSVFVVKNRG